MGDRVSVAMLSPFPPTQGGIATYANDLCTALEDCPEVGPVERLPGEGSEDETWRTIESPSGVLELPGMALRSARRARSSDVLHVQFEYLLYGVFGVAFVPLLSVLARLSGTVPVVTVHSVIARDQCTPGLLAYAGAPGGSVPGGATVAWAFLRAYMQVVALVTAKGIVHTGHHERVLREEYGVPADWLVVVEHGTDCDCAPGAEAAGDGAVENEGDAGTAPGATGDAGPTVVSDGSGEAVEDGGEDPSTDDGREAPTVLYHGFLKPSKGVHRLLQAFQVVRGAYPDAELVIAGTVRPAEADRPETYTYGEWVEDLAAGREGVTLRTDYVPEPELAALVEEADVLALPYRGWVFGASGVLHRVGCTGTPVVTSGHPVFEAVVDGETGLCRDPTDPVAFGDAVVDVLSDPDLAARLGEGLREEMVDRDWDRVASRTGAVYREVVRA